MKPNGLQRLRHDRLLSKANFPRFVETWNWLVSFVENLRGDKDINGQNGRITLDDTDPDHPVIRYEGTDSSATPAASVPRPFDLTMKEVQGEEGPEMKLAVKAGSIPAPISHVSVSSDHVLEEDSGDVWLHVTLSSGNYSAAIDMEEVDDDATHASFKLYVIADGVPVLDCRPMILPLIAP